MSLEVAIPDDVAERLQALVAAGEFPSVQAAAVELIRRGLAARGGPPFRPPMPPPAYPPRPEPGPIQPGPGDVNWMGGKPGASGDGVVR